MSLYCELCIFSVTPKMSVKLNPAELLPQIERKHQRFNSFGGNFKEDESEGGKETEQNLTLISFF